MGPHLLVDKSTIQGLNGEEIKMLHSYYSIVISPILIRELSSYLGKVDFAKEELQHRLQIFAQNTDSIDAAIPEDDKSIIYSELMGFDIPMNGLSIPRAGEKKVTDKDGNKGFFFDEQDERKILRNWADGKFLDSDFEKAKEIRNFDINLELKKWQDVLDKDKGKSETFKSIEDVVKWVDESFLPIFDEKTLLLKMLLKYLGDDAELGRKIWDRWNSNNIATLKNSAPYSYYFCRVICIFYFSTINDFIHISEKNKNHIDIQYAFYLPFSQVLTSGDKFFKKISDLFLRDDQVFISTKELKTDLQNMIAFFNKQTPDEKKAFYEEYGQYPPDIEGSITASLWKKFAKPKPPNAGVMAEMTEEEMDELKSKLKSIIDDANRQ